MHKEPSAFAALQTDYIAQLNLIISEANAALALRIKTSGLQAALSAGGYKITNLGTPTDGGDAVSLTAAQSLLALGATPSSVSIFSLGHSVGVSRALERAQRRTRQLTFA